MTIHDGEPELVPVVGGWFACGHGWCVKGETIDQALAEYHAAVRRHAEIEARPLQSGSEATPTPVIRTAAGLVLALVFAAVAGYYAIAWWAFRITGHPCQMCGSKADYEGFCSGCLFGEEPRPC